MGNLYLLPNLLDEMQSIESFFPKSVVVAVQSIQGLIAESEKIAYRYLRKFLSHEMMAKLPIRCLNKHTLDVEKLLIPIEKGETWGLISDVGLPCIADPGARLVWLAHQKKIQTEALVGPSSIFMALQLSGLNGQIFSFHGYLPKKFLQLRAEILRLEKKIGTQIWIETPYRSQKMLEVLKEVLKPTTRLCLAINVTLKTQKVLSQTVGKWRKTPLTIGKEPTVFLIESQSSY